MSALFNNDLLLRNYQSVLTESELVVSENVAEKDLLESAFEMIKGPTSFASFSSGIVEGLFESDSLVASNISKLLERQRTYILEESTSVASSPEAMSFAVATFPMLVDLYAEPILAKAITVYPYDKPKLTIPRIKWIATIVNEKGEGTDYEYPTATKAIRANVKKVFVGQNDNLFVKLDVDADEFRITKRNARIGKMVVKVDGVEQEVEVFGIFDAKGHFVIDDIELGGKTFTVQGKVEFNNGKIIWSFTDTTPAGVVSSTSVSIDKIEVQFRIYGNGIKKGVVTTKPLMSTIEIDCDIEESFEIREIEEVLQDWKALWNLDILSLLKDHVKDQMKLNKDAEIADLLFGNIPAAKKYNMFREFDLSVWTAAGATGERETKPTTILDIFKNIYPIFVDLTDQMRKRIKMEPKYIICGTKAGSVLKSLQNFEISLNGNSGSIGQVAGTPSMNKFEIIISDAVEEELIHLVTKSEEYRLATILEVTYKPLYVIVETTDSKRRTFIKSRGWIGIVRNEGIATIKVKNFEKYFGQTI